MAALRTFLYVLAATASLLPATAAFSQTSGSGGSRAKRMRRVTPRCNSNG